MGTAGTAWPGQAQRTFLPDLFKAAGCLLIVLHHLAFYGPMADVVARAWPAGVSWLAQHGRLAVQLFLVCSGFLTARALLALGELSAREVGRATVRRYLRLAIPLLPALALTVLVSEAIRPVFIHESLSDVPDWSQVLAHLFFLQHLLDLEALSAGVWYVAVDLQLYLGALLAAWLAQGLQQWGWGQARRWQSLLVTALVVLSISLWTHRDALDDTALFFWGAYGLGWLAWHAREGLSPARRLALWLLLGLLCLVFDARGRALTAWSVACLLACAPAAWCQPPAWCLPRGQALVRGLSRISYAVFVVHFGVCLLVNCAVQSVWPDAVAMNAFGMVAALGLSVWAGAVLHRWTEWGPANWQRWMTGAAAFTASAGLALWLAA